MLIYNNLNKKMIKKNVSPEYSILYIIYALTQEIKSMNNNDFRNIR